MVGHKYRVTTKTSNGQTHTFEDVETGHSEYTIYFRYNVIDVRQIISIDRID